MEKISLNKLFEFIGKEQQDQIDAHFKIKYGEIEKLREWSKKAEILSPFLAKLIDFLKEERGEIYE